MSDRSSTGPVVVATMVALMGALIFAVSLGNSGRHSTRPRTRSETPAPTSAAPEAAPVAVPESDEVLIPRIMERTRSERTAYDEVLAAAVAGDPQGEELLAFYRAHAWFSFFVGTDGEMASIEHDARAEDPLGFEVTIVSPEERDANGLDRRTLWEWRGTENRLLMPPAASCNGAWSGAIMAHELSHAYDALTGVEPRGLPWEDPRFLDGELRAYALTFRLLNRATEGRLEQEVDALVTAFGGAAGADGMLMPSDEPLAALDGLFPFAVSMAEISARRSGYRIYINLRLGEARENDDDWRRNMVLAIMRLDQG